MEANMPIPGNLMTTAMGVMPHTDIDRALQYAVSLDIPYWPQMPNLTYYEDMYVQASEHFPGMALDIEQRSLRFSMDRFVQEYEEAILHMDDPGYFDISEKYSAVYRRFLGLELSGYPAIRGQLEGPISFGFNILDQDNRPILFNDNVRPFMYDFMARRANIQLSRLKERNPNAFMFIDEPGLQFLFSAMSGYDNNSAKKDMDYFYSLIDRPRGVHLCGNPDWDFLLTADLEVISLDAFTNSEILASYAGSIKKFIERGGVVIWGIVPTNYEPFNSESVDSLIKRLEGIWKSLSDKKIDFDLLLSKSLISPATCCLINPDREKTVEKAFDLMRVLSKKMREKYRLA
jgi:hypothetical protein